MLLASATIRPTTPRGARSCAATENPDSAWTPAGAGDHQHRQDGGKTWVERDAETAEAVDDPGGAGDRLARLKRVRKCVALAAPITAPAPSAPSSRP